MSALPSAAPKPPQTYHHGDLAQASIRVAIDLLSEGGIAGLSLREVARRLGVSSTALYHHYPDKEALLVQLSREGLSQFIAFLRPASVTNPFDAIVQMGTNYVRFFQAHPYYLDLLFLPQHKRDATVVGIWHSVMEDLNNLLLAQGWDAQTAPALGVWLWSGVHGLATMFREGILGEPESCPPGALEVFHWSSDEILEHVLPLVSSVLTQARLQKK